jgi:hypothetical protein
MPTIKGHSSRPILVVARREARSVLLAALRGPHLDSLLGDDRRRLDRGMDVRALSDALVCIRSDEQHAIRVHGQEQVRRSDDRVGLGGEEGKLVEQAVGAGAEGAGDPASGGRTVCL